MGEEHLLLYCSVVLLGTQFPLKSFIRTNIYIEYAVKLKFETSSFTLLLFILLSSKHYMVGQF